MFFNYYLPANISFGRGRINEVGQKVKLYGENALLVSGGKSIKRNGTLDKVRVLMEEAGVGVTIFDEVTPNPTNETVIKGTKIAKQNNCDVIVGIGGGSMMDCAKAIAFLSINEGDLFDDYVYKKIKPSSALPIILIPTTCGTGSESNGVAVITNEKNNDKSGISSPILVAKESIVDPELLQTLPKKAFASVGFDAFCHNMESYLSLNATVMTDVYATFAMNLLSKSLIKAYLDISDKEAVDNVSLASTIGGMILFNAGGTAIHGMEHPASGLRNVTHGEGLAALAPYVLEKNIPYAEEKCSKISMILGGNDENDLVEKITDMLNNLNLNIKLSDLGVKKEDIKWMASKCLGKRAMNFNPAKLTYEQIVEIYEKAL